MGIKFDIGGTFSGALGGAGIGFLVGGPIGAAFGAGLGAAGGSGALGKGAQDVSTFGASAQQRAQQQAAEAAQKAADSQAEAQLEANRRSMIQQVRAARIARAQRLNMAVETGGVTSSGTTGALSSISSQLSSNLGYMANQERLANLATDYLSQSSYYTNKATQLGTKWGNISNSAKLMTGAYFGWKEANRLPIYDVSYTAGTGDNVTFTNAYYQG